MAKSLAVLALILIGTSAYAATSGLPEQSVPAPLGVNIHFTGSQQEHVEQIAQAGFKWIRMDVIWQNVEKEKGKYDFKAYDELLDSLDKHDIRALFILCYGNPNYNDNLAPSTDESRKAFAAFAKAAAARYKGRGVVWEIWNEPNISRFWKPDANVDDYVKLVKATSAVVRQADPGSMIIGPATSSWDLDFLEKSFKLGLLDHIDAVSLHPYGAPVPESATEYYNDVKKLVKQHAPQGRDIQLMSGEWGYPSVAPTSVEMQGTYLPRMFLNNLMNGIRLSIWYDWINDGLDPKEPEHNFGTRYNDFTPKPAYHAAQTLARELGGYSYITRLYSDSDDDYLLLFGKGDDYRLAAWTAKSTHKIKMPVDVEKFEVVTHTGVRSHIESVNGNLAIELTAGPKYIEPLGVSKRWAVEASWKIGAAADIQNGVIAKIISDIGYMGVGGRMSVSGRGVGNAEVTVVNRNNAASAAPGERFRSELETKLVGNGGASTRANVTIELKGFDQPFVRIVEVETSVCPATEVLPPVSRELLFRVARPVQAPRGDYKGTLEVGNFDGIQLNNTKIDFSIPSGKQETIVRLPLEQEPAALFSFSYKIVDREGNDVVRMPAMQYSVLEAFAGRVGERVGKYSVEPDGDSKVSCEAGFTYANSPAGGPGSVCARLDYDMGEGWRFVRVSPRPMIPIHAQPRSVKLWVKGDNSDSLIRLRITDSGKQTFQQDFGRLNFTDWRCLESKLDGSGAGFWGGRNDGVVRYPISWDTILLLDKNADEARKGTVYFGPMMMCYE